MFIHRAFMAGEPRYNTPDDGAGSGTPGNEGAGKKPSGGETDLFDKGFGKGIAKGKAEAQAALLAELGVTSIDDLKASVKTASQATKAAEKAAAEQGRFKELYEAEKAKNAELEPFRARVLKIEQQQKTELAAMTEKFSEADKALIADLPIEKALQVAKRMTGAADGPVGGKPVGNGKEPGTGGGKDLAFYEKKGYWNLTPEERADCDRLQAELDSKVTVGDLAQAHMMGVQKLPE